MENKKPQGCLKRLISQIGAVLSSAYLLNLGYGIVDLIPDNLPVAGNIDEVVASLILFVCLNSLGIGPDRLFKRKATFTPSKNQNTPPIQDAEIVEDDKR